MLHLTAWEYKPLYRNAFIHFKQLQNTIVYDIVAPAADGTIASVYRKQRPLVQECAVSWCMKTIRASYLSGMYQEDVPNTLYNTTPGSSSWSSESFPTDLDNGAQTGYHQNTNIEHKNRNGPGAVQICGSLNDTAAMLGQSFQGVRSSTTQDPSD